MKDILVLYRVRNKKSQLFFLLKHKVDWNGRYETPAGKAWQGGPPPACRGGSRNTRGKRVPEVEI
ncbi:hypothetical protein ASG97_18185 [Bacillus sp. Soil745]|nr:hypothetical protein ASG97_18185 [Bacillus sp. Soil745]